MFDTAEWLEKRHEWKDALMDYSQKLSEDEGNLQYQFGKLRCLKNLSDWNNLSGLVK